MRDVAETTAFIQPTGQRVSQSLFDLAAYAPDERLLAWRARVAHVIDVVHTRDDLAHPFDAAIRRYQAGDVALTDCRSDALALERTLARISTDTVRTFAFHVFTEGGMQDVRVRSASLGDSGGAGSIVALDMNEPVRMHRTRCRVITLFAPAELVQAEFQWPDALHGRALQCTTPLSRLAVEHIVALNREIAAMSPEAAGTAIRDATRLVVAAFARQARLGGNARAAVRAAMFGRVRRYVRANLHQESLSPEHVLQALQLTRPTLYRMFQHEGGLGSYIRHVRLREAAEELRLRPDLMVADIAYGCGFRSASDFTRAFRRAFDMTPQDFRQACATVPAMPGARRGYSTSR